MYKKTILCAVIIAAATSPLVAQTESSLFAKPSTSTKTSLLTAGTGILAGGATYCILSKIFNCLDIEHVNIRATMGGLFNLGQFNILAGVRHTFTTPANYVIGAATLSLGALAAWLTYRYQPEGKFGRAHSTLMEALNDEILNDLIQAEQNLIENINNSYIYYTYPRVAAYNEFINYHQNLIDATNLLKEAITASEDAELIELAQHCITAINQYVDTIKGCINIIRNSDNWIEELKGHDAMLARQAQERAAIASQQIAWNTAFRNM